MTVEIPERDVRELAESYVNCFQNPGRAACERYEKAKLMVAVNICADHIAVDVNADGQRFVHTVGLPA